MEYQSSTTADAWYESYESYTDSASGLDGMYISGSGYTYILLPSGVTKVNTIEVEHDELKELFEKEL